MTQLETGTDEDTRASYPPGEFGHETGLSDPGLAAEQDDRGARQRRIEDLEEAVRPTNVAEVIRPGMSASIPVGMPKALTADSITR